MWKELTVVLYIVGALQSGWTYHNIKQLYPQTIMVMVGWPVFGFIAPSLKE